jgi:glycerol-3-phosphate acyltransferase PlsY
MVMFWPVGLVTFAVFLVVVGVSRYVSLGSILGSLTMLVAMIPLVVYGSEPFAYIAFGLVVVPIVIFRHRDNIRRLLSRTESKIGSSRAIK